MKNTPSDRKILVIDKKSIKNLNEDILREKCEILEIHLRDIRFIVFVDVLRKMLEKNLYKTIIVYDEEIRRGYNKNVKASHKRKC